MTASAGMTVKTAFAGTTAVPRQKKPRIAGLFTVYYDGPHLLAAVLLLTLITLR